MFVQERIINLHIRMFLSIDTAFEESFL